MIQTICSNKGTLERTELDMSTEEERNGNGSLNTEIFVKLGTKTVEKFLNLADDNFIHDVNDDLRLFVSERRFDSVLVFPPVSNYRRFLIHRCVEQLGRPELATFSIGACDERRTVVCYKQKILSDEACACPGMGLKPAEPHDATISHTSAAVGGCKAARAQEKFRSGSAKPRRPDRAVYVPRALRCAEASANAQPEDARPPEGESESADGPSERPRSPPPPRDRSTGTPRKSIDKNFCNVYTPPHLRSHRPRAAPSIEPPAAPARPDHSACSDHTDTSSIDVEVDKNFYIGDYFANGQLGFYAPPYYGDYCDGTGDGWPASEPHATMAVNGGDRPIMDGEYSYDKDEDAEKKELKRASREINRSSKRIIKQSFDSDVLVISDAADEGDRDGGTARAGREEKENKRAPKPKLEARASLRREDHDWEAVFDESGECLDPSLLEELAATVGEVRISRPRNSYEPYQTRGQAMLGAPLDEAFAHVVEVYDFPGEFKTNDLLSLFSEYKDTGFEIKWVDDTHALIVFSSAKIAAEVLSQQRSLARCRPLHAATLESRNKAKKCAEFLQPYRQRPETCTALARRLVSGALGVKLSTARQERAEERRLITLAREKKRQAALHKEAAWDGSLANQSAPET